MPLHLYPDVYASCNLMIKGVDLKTLLSVSGVTPTGRRALFAWVSLGLIEALANGLVSASDAVRLFFNAANCVFVRKRFRGKVADEIMSRGAQLPDLFEALPAKEAQREFQRELAIMRAACLKLLEEKPIGRLAG